MFLFLCTKLFQKGDTIQGGTLFKEIRYLQNNFSGIDFLVLYMVRNFYVSNLTVDFILIVLSNCLQYIYFFSKHKEYLKILK